jgi:hypothetical protein
VEFGLMELAQKYIPTHGKCRFVWPATAREAHLLIRFKRCWEPSGNMIDKQGSKIGIYELEKFVLIPSINNKWGMLH